MDPRVSATDPWWTGYLGVPWVWRGRDPQGWDCWGLVAWCLAHHHGIRVPDFLAETADVDPADRASRYALQEAAFVTGRAGWTRLDRPEPGAAALCLVGVRPIHVGLCVGSGLYLHVDRTSPTELARLSAPKWRDRIEGFYRAP
jgi:cell wall-associated NlpC family hydrolase